MTTKQLRNFEMTDAEGKCFCDAVSALGPDQFRAIMMESTELNFIASHILDSIRRKRLDQKYGVSSETVIRKYKAFAEIIGIAQALGLLPGPNDDLDTDAAPRFHD